MTILHDYSYKRYDVGNHVMAISHHNSQRMCACACALLTAMIQRLHVRFGAHQVAQLYLRHRQQKHDKAHSLAYAIIMHTVAIHRYHHCCPYSLSLRTAQDCRYKYLLIRYGTAWLRIVRPCSCLNVLVRYPYASETDPLESRVSRAAGQQTWVVPPTVAWVRRLRRANFHFSF